MWERSLYVRGDRFTKTRKLQSKTSGKGWSICLSGRKWKGNQDSETTKGGYEAANKKKKGGKIQRTENQSTINQKMTSKRDTEVVLKCRTCGGSQGEGVCEKVQLWGIIRSSFCVGMGGEKQSALGTLEGKKGGKNERESLDKQTSQKRGEGKGGSPKFMR